MSIANPRRSEFMYNFKVLIVAVIFVLPSNVFAAILREGDACIAGGINGDCIGYLACKSRTGGRNFADSNVIFCGSTTRTDLESSLVCCTTKARNDRTLDESRSRNSLQSEYETSNDEIETISDLQDVLRNSNRDESRRRKHSIATSQNDQNQNDHRNRHKEEGGSGFNNIQQEKSKQATDSNRHQPVRNYHNIVNQESIIKGHTESNAYSPVPNPIQPFGSGTKRTPTRKPISTYEASQDHYENRPMVSDYKPNRRPSSNSQEYLSLTYTPPLYNRPTTPYSFELPTTPRYQNQKPASSGSGWQEAASPLIENENGYPVRDKSTPKPQQNRYPTRGTSTQRPYQNNKRKRSRISEIKCKEYSETVKETIAGLPLTTDPKPMEISIDKCNYNAQQLIVGGQNASLGEFPHMAAVGFREPQRGTISWNCGGSLISEKFILTAAHCTTSSLGVPTVVRLGDFNLRRSDDGAYPVQYFVKQVYRHPDYKPPIRYNDIALLRLSRDVAFTPHIRPACLYGKPNFNTGKTVATGWGRIAYAEEQSDVLLKVVLSLIDNEQCNSFYRAESATDMLSRGIINEQLCAGELSGGKDTCQGDSGGPVEVTSHSNQCVHHIIGVTSFGKKCGQPEAPGVYTRVSSYLTWIESVVWPNGDTSN